jgi:hypothetical protein
MGPSRPQVAGAGLVGVGSSACTGPQQRHLVDTPKPDQLATDSRQISRSQGARDQPNCQTHRHLGANQDAGMVVTARQHF